jgi:hypothetical protein
MAAGMLEQHYRRESKPAEVQRIVRTYGQAFESAAAWKAPRWCGGAQGLRRGCYPEWRKRLRRADGLPG